MKRILWIAAIVVLIVAGIWIVRALWGLAGQPAKVEHGGGIEPGAPARMVRLYYGARDRVSLAGEDRAIPDPGGDEAMIERILREYLRGSPAGITGFGSGIGVRGVFLADDGTAFVDFSSEMLARWPRGDGLEWVSVGGIVRSVTENVPAVRRVQILVEGKVVERAPGAIAIDLPLEPQGFRSLAEETES